MDAGGEPHAKLQLRHPMRRRREEPPGQEHPRDHPVKRGTAPASRLRDEAGVARSAKDEQLHPIISEGTYGKSTF